MDEKITIADLRQNLNIIKSEYSFTEYESDHGRESYYQLLYIIGQQNELFDKIINFIETLENKN